MPICPPMRARRLAASSIVLAHRDFSILDPLAAEILGRVPELIATLPDQMLAALESVLEPVRTGRTQLSDLDNVEKTFVGLKVEHFVRDMLDAPKGIRDLVLAGQNVDIKNTVGNSWSWMIPPETYRKSEPCLLMALDAARWEAWMGLIVARPDYLGKPNRDGKRRILSKAYTHISWLVQAARLPRNHWDGIDMARFRDLRKVNGGNVRAERYFIENLRRPTHRSVLLALLYDQKDPMKRVRGNGGVKDILKPQGIAILSGKYDSALLRRLGYSDVGLEEHIAVDARSAADARLLREGGSL